MKRLLIHLLLRLTGGRPMRFAKRHIGDHRPGVLAIYEDAFGRYWLAAGPWDFYRMRREAGPDGGAPDGIGDILERFSQRLREAERQEFDLGTATRTARPDPSRLPAPPLLITFVPDSSSETSP